MMVSIICIVIGLVAIATTYICVGIQGYKDGVRDRKVKVMAEVIIKCSDEAAEGKTLYGEPIQKIVRCKDCKHWVNDSFKVWESAKVCDYAHWYIGANGYCVYGEEKEDAE